MKGSKSKFSVGKIIEHEKESYEILEYVSRCYRSVKILPTGTVLPKVHTWQLTTGEIKDPMKPLVYEVGYFGIGEYKCKVNGKGCKAYNCWSGMLERCYSDKYHLTCRYKGRGVKVCDDWHNYQTFAKWFKDNYIEGFELDKDILSGKLYSPETCVFIPKELNTFFTARHKARGEYPLGVGYDKLSKKFQVNLNNGKGKGVYLGLHSTPEDAFQVYKREKEKMCKAYAKDYLEKGWISEKTYNALMSWEVVEYLE